MYRLNFRHFILDAWYKAKDVRITVAEKDTELIADENLCALQNGTLPGELTVPCRPPLPGKNVQIQNSRDFYHQPLHLSEVIVNGR